MTKKDKDTLYLPIKQVYFDQIIAGSKKEEYREIKETTFTKYLENEKGCLFYDTAKMAEDDLMNGDPMAYNNGNYPYYPIEYKYLNLAVGYEKERDTALVEVVDITFEVMKTKDGKSIIFDMDEQGKYTMTDNGPCAFWLIVYHLGKVVELHRKGE